MEIHRCSVDEVRAGSTRQAVRRGAKNAYVPQGDILAERSYPVGGSLGHDAIRIVVPQEFRLSGEDGVIIINDPRLGGGKTFWSSAGETFAKEAGVRITKLEHADGKRRGTKVEFTKEGDFEINGELIRVRREGEVKIERTAASALRSVDVNFGNTTPRSIEVKINGRTHSINSRLAQPDQPLHAPDGITVVPSPDGKRGKFSIIFTQPGTFELNGWEDRAGQRVFGPTEVKVAKPQGYAPPKEEETLRKPKRASPPDESSPAAPAESG